MISQQASIDELLEIINIMTSYYENYLFTGIDLNPIKISDNKLIVSSYSIKSISENGIMLIVIDKNKIISDFLFSFTHEKSIGIEPKIFNFKTYVMDNNLEIKGTYSYLKNNSLKLSFRNFMIMINIEDNKINLIKKKF